MPLPGLHRLDMTLLALCAIIGNRDSHPQANMTWQCTKKNDSLHSPDTPHLLGLLQYAYPSNITNRNPAQNPEYLTRYAAGTRASGPAVAGDGSYTTCCSPCLPSAPAPAAGGGGNLRFG